MRVQDGRTRRDNLGTHAESVNVVQSVAAYPRGVASAVVVVLLVRFEVLMFLGDQEKENVSDSFLKSVVWPI